MTLVFSAKHVDLYGGLSVGVECLLGLKRYGTEWKEERRTFHQTLVAQASDYYPIQLEGARKFLLAVLESPTDAVKQVEL